MTSHVTDDLPLLLSGEASREDVLAAAAHLRSCEDCRQELVSAVMAHASLTSAQRFAPEIARRADTVDQPPPSQLPDLTAVFAQVRDEADAVAAKRGRSVRSRVLAIAAAACVVGAGATVATVLTVGSQSAQSARSIALSAFGTGHVGATAKLVDDRLTLDASALPAPDRDHRYEVWVTNAARTAMQPVGWVGTDGRATLTMPPNLMHAFSAIEVSVQQVDAPTYTYSGTSVLRGSY